MLTTVRWESMVGQRTWYRARVEYEEEGRDPQTYEALVGPHAEVPGGHSFVVVLNGSVLARGEALSRSRAARAALQAIDEAALLRADSFTTTRQVTPLDAPYATVRDHVAAASNRRASGQEPPREET